MISIKKQNGIHQYLGIFCLAILAILIRVITFVAFGSSTPFGYDTGFYRRYLVEPIHFFQNVPGLGPNSIFVKIILDILKTTHMSANMILYGSLVLLGGAITLAIYFLVKKYSNNATALWAGFLFAISPIQYFTYWCMLYKNAWGLLLLVIAMILIHKRSQWIYVCAILLACTHETTAIMFLLSLVTFWIINKERRLEIFKIIVITAVTLGLTQTKGASDVLVHLPQASFNSWFQYIVFSFPLIIAAIIGTKTWWQSSKKSFLTAFLITTIAYPILHLPFYQRIFVYTDISIIILGAYGLAVLFDEKKKINHILGILLIAGAVCILANRIYKLQPVMYDDNIRNLEQIDGATPTDSYILTTSNLAPWVEGWSHRHVIAPGMLIDTHNNNEWIKFWAASDADKVRFLNDFPKPLYFFIPENERKLFIPTSCGTRIGSTAIIKYTCN